MYNLILEINYFIDNNQSFIISRSFLFFFYRTNGESIRKISSIVNDSLKIIIQRTISYYESIFDTTKANILDNNDAIINFSKFIIYVSRWNIYFVIYSIISLSIGRFQFIAIYSKKVYRISIFFSSYKLA